MPWQNDGDYYSFKASEIEARAPAAPGVYGLYNFRHHIAIASSENIRAALLRHLRHTDFRFRRFQPTGFTFELCPNDLRNARMQQLIVEYDPVMQAPAGIGPRSLWRSWITPRARAFQTAPRKPATDTRFYRPKLRLAPVMCAALTPVAALFALIPDFQSSARVFVAGVFSVINRDISAAQTTRIAAIAPSREASRAREQALPSNDSTASDDNRRTQPENQSRIDSPPAENSATVVIQVPSTDSLRDAAIADPVSAPKHWTVQVFATPDRDIAASWMEKLNVKGYDAFVTEAEVSGKRWYRVRLGHFKTHADAQKFSARMRVEEGFDDAFVTLGAKSESPALKRALR